MWLGALFVMGFFTLDGFITIESAKSAPQQAGAGAAACFHLIAVYVLARGVDALLD